MGLQGPRKKSAASQQRRGNPGKRKRRPPAAKVAPTAPKAPDIPKPPSWLRGVAATKWRELAPILARRGLLLDLDLDALTLYCDAWQQLHDASGALEEAEFIVNEKGAVYAHPAVHKRNKAIDRIRKIGEQLGLTPNSRRGLELGLAEKDPLAEFLGKK